MKRCICFLAFLSIVLMAGCGSDTPTISENNDGQAQLAPAYSETQINSLILAEAARQVGRPSNNCKEWVRSVVLNATDREIPATDNTNYRWVSSSVARVIWQRWEPLVLAPQYFTTQFPSYLLPGQIVQLRWRLTYMNGGPHTIILKSISSSSILYYEANAGPVTKLSTMSIGTWHALVDAWTVYQVI